MTNPNAMANLLTKILDSQIESGRYSSIKESRLRESSTTGPKLTEAEQCLLLLSPLARSDYKRIRGEIRNENLARLDTLRVERQLFPLAAASDEDTIVMKNNGFTVTLYRRKDLGIPWIILVQLGSLYLNAIYPMTTLRLVDSGGLEWLRGRPDINGEITAHWVDELTDILARSKRFSLLLEPV